MRKATCHQIIVLPAHRCPCDFKIVSAPASLPSRKLRCIPPPLTRVPSCMSTREAAAGVACLQAGQIVDDELNRLLVNPLPPGVRLHAIIDACHSGSVLDLEYRAEFRDGAPVWTNEYSRRPSIYKV